MRKNAREDAFRLLFEQHVNPEEAAEKLERYFETAGKEGKTEEPFYVNRPSEQDTAYTRKVVEGVQAHMGEIDARIQENLKDWEMDRVSKISIAVLRLSIYEILHMEDIPAEVSAVAKSISKFLMVSALAAIGLNTSFKDMKKSGINPMIHGFIISALVVIVAIGVEWFMGIV